MKAAKRQEYKDKELLKRNADKETSDKMNQEQKDEVYTSYIINIIIVYIVIFIHIIHSYQIIKDVKLIYILKCLFIYIFIETTI